MAVRFASGVFLLAVVAAVVDKLVQVHSLAVGTVELVWRRYEHRFKTVDCVKVASDCRISKSRMSVLIGF